MRLIGTLNNKFHAERFAACMTLKEIATHLEQETNKEGVTSWEVWIKDEEKVPLAATEFEKFQNDPDAPHYSKVVEEATAILKKKKLERQTIKKNLVNIQDQWQTPGARPRPPLTIALIIVAVLVTITTSMGDDRQSPVFRALAFTSLSPKQVEAMENSRTISSARTASIRNFELWRTITPIFIHFGVLHILFNCWWMFYFGQQIENRYGAVWLAILVVIIAIPSNAIGALVPLDWQGSGIDPTGEYWVMPSGGLSGVLYGLFGYIWMKMLFDRSSNFFLTPFTIAILMGWFVICIATSGEGLIAGRINNWAHGVGLVVGLIIGYFPKLVSDVTAGNKPAAKK